MMARHRQFPIIGCQLSQASRLARGVSWRVGWGGGIAARRLGAIAAS
jgi:hypothetical protein